MSRSDRDTARAVLDRYGTTYAAEAGISLADAPAPLFQLLVLTDLLSARISADLAVAAAGELIDAGLTTAEHLLDAGWQERVDALGRGHYRRYDERSATQLGDAAQLALDRYDGDLRRLADAADREPGRAGELLQEFPGIGRTGASVFLREVQRVWAWARPHLDDRCLEGAGEVGLPADPGRLADLVAADDLAGFATGLVRIALLRGDGDPLAG